MFQVGKEINRRQDIHATYGGQRQGGIATPKGVEAIFLFTSPSGEAHGYSDGFRDDGTFWYTGEGQFGDMTMQKGNRAIFNHKENGKEIYLFEYTRKAHVRLLGKAECIGHHMEQRPDTEGNLRKAFIFHLGLNIEQGGENGDLKTPFIDIDPKKISGKNRSLSELRCLALSSTEGIQSTTQKQREIYIRANAIKEYVLKRADGSCEYCSKTAPFITKVGPYLECHHILRLSDGGPDHPNNVIGICPNCHREAHYALGKEEVNQAMLKAVGVLEALPEESI
jgi:5-methylcytosine-specific restriction protein A